jgi:hypothetical protein
MDSSRAKNHGTTTANGLKVETKDNLKDLLFAVL